MCEGGRGLTAGDVSVCLSICCDGAYHAASAGTLVRPCEIYLASWTTGGESVTQAWSGQVGAATSRGPGALWNVGRAGVLIVTGGMQGGIGGGM